MIILLGFLTLLVVFFGFALGGRQGMMVAFCFACLINFGAWWFSDKILLSMYRAQPLAEEEAPEVFEIVRKLSEKAGIPMPKLFMLPSASANAFATGRDPQHAAIAVTHGIVGLLNKEELSGVLGHELAHILNRDILLSSIVATLAGALSMIASMFRWSFFWGGERDEHDKGHPLALLLASILMPFVAMLIQLAISRSREYEADLGGVRLCEEPLYLASALRKIDAASKRFPLRDAEPATAHLFIANPLSGKGWSALFSTHPSIDDRIARLEAMIHFPTN
ncbi:MAG: zinc metalloprotease HtpX [Candidatus Omnitrophica bacterium]|nr:zinc metalloprotease HtpX [Candidatus Omnitrophota bacterium]